MAVAQVKIPVQATPVVVAVALPELEFRLLQVPMQVMGARALKIRLTERRLIMLRVAEALLKMPEPQQVAAAAA